MPVWQLQGFMGCFPAYEAASTNVPGGKLTNLQHWPICAKNLIDFRQITQLTESQDSWSEKAPLTNQFILSGKGKLKKAAEGHVHSGLEDLQDPTTSLANLFQRVSVLTVKRCFVVVVACFVFVFKCLNGISCIWVCADWLIFLLGTTEKNSIFFSPSITYLCTWNRSP